MYSQHYSTVNRGDFEHFSDFPLKYRKKMAFKVTPCLGDFEVTLNNFDMLALFIDLTLLILSNPFQTMLDLFLRS